MRMKRKYRLFIRKICFPYIYFAFPETSFPERMIRKYMSFYWPFLLDILSSLDNPVASPAINMKIGKSMKIFMLAKSEAL